MSLYNNFGSKDDLVLAYLEMRHAEWMELYNRRVVVATSPLERMIAVFDAYIDHAEAAYRIGFRGCGILNAAAELPVGAPGRELVRRHKEEVEALLFSHLVEMGSRSEADARALAEQLAFVLEGAMARAGLEGKADRLFRARELAVQIAAPD